MTPDSGAYDLHSRAGACCAKGGGGKPANHGCWSPMEHGKPGGGFKCFSIFTPYTWEMICRSRPKNLREFDVSILKGASCLGEGA